jgi:hypothetical protein
MRERNRTIFAVGNGKFDIYESIGFVDWFDGATKEDIAATPGRYPRIDKRIMCQNISKYLGMGNIQMKVCGPVRVQRVSVKFRVSSPQKCNG